jgi:hypothetical protein
MGPFEMVVIIVFLSMLTGTAHKYLDCRASIAKAQGGRGDKSVLLGAAVDIMSTAKRAGASHIAILTAPGK